jgi:hypothetical protein
MSSFVSNCKQLDKYVSYFLESPTHIDDYTKYFLESDTTVNLYVHSRRCSPWSRRFRHQAHRARTRRPRRSATAKRSGLVPGIHPQSTFLHSRSRREGGSNCGKKNWSSFFGVFPYNFSFNMSPLRALEPVLTQTTLPGIFFTDILHKN